MSKLGLAACSILTLGCVCLLCPSGPPGEGCPCTYLPAEVADRSVSPRSTESIILRLVGDCEGCWRAFRTGSDCSLEGGTGGCSGSGVGTSSPNGPRGPRESSTASRRVAWAPTRRGVRGPLAVGDLGAADADELRFDDGLGLFSSPRYQSTRVHRYRRWD